jgi:hypothetical protein
MQQVVIVRPAIVVVGHPLGVGLRGGDGGGDEQPGYDGVSAHGSLSRERERRKEKGERRKEKGKRTAN